jgi:hypothetical protein
MASWAEFEHQAPALSALCYQRFKSSDLVMLGTIRKNGFPRISPIEWVIFEGELVLGGIWQAKKALDLLRDPRCTIHSTTVNKDGQEGDAKLWGRATPLAEDRVEDYWQWVFEQSGWRANGPAHIFTIDLESAAFVTFRGDGTMRRLQWPGAGDWIESKHA